MNADLFCRADHASCQLHYENLLSRVYAWRCDGADAAFAAAHQELSRILGSSRAGTAIDLGCGFGKHAVPLARAGWEVTAIDSSAQLLEELRTHANNLPIVRVPGDLRRLAELRLPNADLVLCLGDTLAHMDGPQEVDGLLQDAVLLLKPGGKLITWFRDYRALTALQSIVVRADHERVLTCLLEPGPGRLHVTDILHEAIGEPPSRSWSVSASRYAKLRLDPESVAEHLRKLGLVTSLQPSGGGWYVLGVNE